ncbi:MAG: electron transfer flavoprotein subunit alpha/FixB family protein [Flavipsychrobacter sp.]|jgi:electron transfer flavoprotein alpha subunit|nr:electron transfer flavoprotein subunit alpha/FixB family protein [Flavipsychrobacter sp.]
MSVLVLVEHSQGVFKKKSLEAVQYAAHVAKELGTSVTAVAVGNVDNAAMQGLGAYGANKVLHTTESRLENFNSRAYTKVMLAAAQKESAKVIVGLHDTVGKAVSPRLAARLKAGMVAGAVGYPDLSKGFVVKKNVFSGKAFAFVNVTSDVKVITLMPNTFQVVKGEGSATVENLDIAFDDKDFSIQVKEVSKASGSVPLSEAELVVSGGRGLKGPENWHVLEGLAKELGAALACSRPVADSHWRPHHEHVGQTGGTIRPNLYIAVGISGAIQHLAGVNGSKTIVVINKDAEAPFFSAANYGVLGDALEVIPKLTEAVKRFKANH